MVTKIIISSFLHQNTVKSNHWQLTSKCLLTKSIWKKLLAFNLLLKVIESSNFSNVYKCNTSSVFLSFYIFNRFMSHRVEIFDDFWHLIYVSMEYCFYLLLVSLFWYTFYINEHYYGNFLHTNDKINCG